MSGFDAVFDVILPLEGGFSDDPRDPGNWTGGACGEGECRGTNFGISAAAYPDVGIVTLTRAEALAIYRRDYWNPLRGDELPPSLALLLTDAAVNSGRESAVKWLQAALGVPPDGVLGPGTLSAVLALPTRGPDAFAAAAVSFTQRRLIHLSECSAWPVYRLGWVHRALFIHTTAFTQFL